jgi:hypothetical protein
MHKKTRRPQDPLDIPLQFESDLVARALISPDEEDDATKGFVGGVEAALIGTQRTRTTIAELLFRPE